MKPEISSHMLDTKCLGFFFVGFLSQEFLDVRNNVVGGEVRSVSLVGDTISVAKEFGKVPFDGICYCSWELLLQPLKGMSVDQ